MEKLSTVVYLRYWTCYFSGVVGLQLREKVTTENLRKKNNKKLRYKQRETPLFFVNQSGSHVITCNLAAAKLMIH